MRAFLAIVGKELYALFTLPIAYAVLTGTIFVAGWLFFDNLAYYNRIIMVQTAQAMASQDVLAYVPSDISLYTLVVRPTVGQLTLFLMVFVPLITMRVFAEERQRGTYELLLTTPVSVAKIVGGKYVACSLFLVLMLAATIIFPAVAVTQIQSEIGWAHMFAIYLGLTAFALALAALGLLCSSLTENQIIAALLSYVLSVALYDLSWMQGVLGNTVAPLAKEIALQTHFTSFAEGIIDTHDLTYFASLGFVAFVLTAMSVEQTRFR